MSKWNNFSNWFKALIILLIAIGIFFRVFNLENKVYWHDETYTSLRISGYTAKEVQQQVYNGSIIGIQDLIKYQQPNSEKSLIDTIKGLAVEEPQLPPLYFTMVRFWVQWFGSSVVWTRSLSAIFSLLAFPCLYWMCRQLFESPITAWLAIALIAISPFHLLYAQEARPYSLWLTTILLSNAALLSAMRLRTKLRWIIYAVTLSLSFYTHLLSIVVAIGQGIYIFIITGYRWNKNFYSYLTASALAVLAFSPWLFLLVSNFGRAQYTTSGSTEKIPLLNLVKRWLDNLTRIFVDIIPNSLSPREPSLVLILFGILIVLVLLLVIYSIYFLCRTTPQKTWLFVLTLIGTTGLSLVLPDLILGGIRSTEGRYLIPCYLGIQLAVAHLLANKITSFSSTSRTSKLLWRLVITLVLTSGVVSCTIISLSPYWWNKYGNVYSPEIATIINKFPHPLVISDAYIGRIMPYIYLLKPQVQIELIKPPILPHIPKGFDDVFLLTPSVSSRQYLEKNNYKIDPLHNKYEYDNLWQITRR